MTGRKEIYVYLQCFECDDIFRVLKSSYNHVFDYTLVSFLRCPSCNVIRPAAIYKRVTRKEWKKSNEVKPDNVA